MQALLTQLNNLETVPLQLLTFKDGTTFTNGLAEFVSKPETSAIVAYAFVPALIATSDQNQVPNIFEDFDSNLSDVPMHDGDNDIEQSRPWQSICFEANRVEL